MHELAICQALIEQVEAIARERLARRVGTVCVSIGPLSGVEPRLLEQAFPVASAGRNTATRYQHGGNRDDQEGQKRPRRRDIRSVAYRQAAR